VEEQRLAEAPTAPRPPHPQRRRPATRAGGVREVDLDPVGVADRLEPGGRERVGDPHVGFGHPRAEPPLLGTLLQPRDELGDDLGRVGAGATFTSHHHSGGSPRVGSASA